MIFVDSHEDIAISALMYGRRYFDSVAAIRASEVGTAVPEQNGEAMLGWPDWIHGQVAVVFSTITAVPKRHSLGEWDNFAYGSIEEAHARYRDNLAYYDKLVSDHPDKFQFVRSIADLDAHLEPWLAEREAGRRVGFVFLMEGADGIRTPDEVRWWYDKGVRIVGPAWSGTQYSGGTREPGPFTDDGRALLALMAEIGMALDMSHLSAEATEEALGSFPGRLMASHSNARALIEGSEEPDRHLSDEHIRGIISRGGVIGVVPYNPYLVPGWQRSTGRDGVSLDLLVDQIDHICSIAGDTEHVGIGTDFDGGFGLDSVPIGIDGIGEVGAIGDRLLRRDYKGADVAKVLGGNWLRFLRETLPA